MSARFAGLPRPAVNPERHLVPHSAGPDVPVLVYDPGAQRSGAAILHIEGGEMIAGRPELTICAATTKQMTPARPDASQGFDQPRTGVAGGWLAGPVL